MSTPSTSEPRAARRVSSLAAAPLPLGLSVAVFLLAQPARAATPQKPVPTPPPPATTRLLTVDDIFNLKDVGDPRLSPDGQWVAYTVSELDAKEDEERTQIWMSPVAGGDALRLTTGKKSATRPRFSPDGRWLAFLAKRDDDKKKQVYLLDRRGGEAVRLTDYKADVSDLDWSPDSTRLALVVHDVDPDDPDLDDEAGDDGAKPAAGAAKKKLKPIVIRRRQFKRDGEGYLRELRDHVQVFDLRAKTSVQVTSGTYDDSEPVWSPDGRSIAFISNRTVDPDSNQNSDVFLVAAEAGATPRALTASPGIDRAPSFSPDGKWIAYVAGGDPKDMWYGTDNLGVVAVAGGPEQVLTRPLDRNVSQPRFSGDGRSILFLVEDGGNSHLMRIPLGGGAIERVVGGERDLKAFDLARGTLVALETTPHQPPEISAVSLGGQDAGALRRITTVNDAFLKGIRLAPVERFQAKSPDGTPIDVFLTRPPDAPAGMRLPTILRIHGGPTSQYSTEFELEWQMLAAHGYAVVGANPRGSTGYGQAFARAIWADWGNKDYEDVVAAVVAAIERGIADPERLGVGGWSYGGILTNYVLVKTGRFKAATSGASEANYPANYGHDHYQYEWETELGLPWKETDRWLRLWPWYQVEKVTTPTLVMCGEDDWNGYLGTRCVSGDRTHGLRQPRGVVSDKPGKRPNEHGGTAVPYRTPGTREGRKGVPAIGHLTRDENRHNLIERSVILDRRKPLDQRSWFGFAWAHGKRYLRASWRVIVSAELWCVKRLQRSGFVGPARQAASLGAAWIAGRCGRQGAVFGRASLLCLKPYA